MVLRLLEKRMNTDPTSAEGLDISDAEAPAPTPSLAQGWSKRDQAPLPARTLGPKASVLQARRQRMRSSESKLIATMNGNFVATADGALSFMMHGTDSGLYLEKNTAPTPWHPSDALDGFCMRCGVQDLVRCGAAEVRQPEPASTPAAPRRGVLRCKPLNT